jgi:hypothetical protein
MKPRWSDEVRASYPSDGGRRKIFEGGIEDGDLQLAALVTNGLAAIL